MTGFALRPGAEAQEVPMEQRHVVCPAHAEPLREDWPAGWDVFATIVATKALESPMLQTGARGDPAFWRNPSLRWGELPAAIGPAEVRALLEVRPACEWIEPAVLLAAYLAANIGRMGLCRLCGVLRRGTRYGVVSGRGHDVFPHVCFHCVAAGVTRKA